jgi:hypothetical protein
VVEALPANAVWPDTLRSVTVVEASVVVPDTKVLPVTVRVVADAWFTAN